MDFHFEPSDDKLKFGTKWFTSCHKNTLDSDLREQPVSCEEDFELQHHDDDDDDGYIPLSTRLSPISSLETCSSSKHDNVSVMKRDTNIMPVKRVFDNENSLHVSVKKLKVSVVDDSDEEEDKSFSLLKKELKMAHKVFKECKRKSRVEKKRLQLIQRDVEECCKELRNKKNQFRCVRRIKEIHDKMQGKVERKEEELKALSEKIAECAVELETKQKELESERKKLLKVISIRQKHIDCAQVKDFESMKKQFEGQVKELESKVKECEGRVEEFESNEKNFEGRVKALESREKQVEGLMKEFEFMEEVLESREKKLESKEKKVEGQEMELKSKENQIEVREKDFETKQKKFEDQVKELKFERKHFENQLKELESKENLFIGRVKEFESKKNEFEVQLAELVKELVSKQKNFNSRMKVVESKEKQQESRVKEYESKEKQLEDRVKELESKENKFKVKMKELKLKEKLFEEQVKELESKLNKFDGELKEPELRGKKNEALMKSIDEEKESVVSDMDDQLSPAIDGTMQLNTSEKTDGVGPLFDEILVYLLESSDPSRLVLDIIQKPFSPSYKNGDKAVIIDGSHIYLLERLMRISPDIEPCVREEALKLALDLKAYVQENTENSLAVLGFLLLLSIYGLLTSFNNDEILELFAFVAQYKIAMEMFETLGFANKVSDFVENLIKRKQFVVAVRFSSAYNLASKNQLVDMLRQHVQNAKLICEISCAKTKSVEIKDKARDQEIASLGTVLQCISDNSSLESEDLLNKEIQRRILELKAQKGT